MGARVYAAGARVYASLVIIVSAQVLWVLTLGLWTLDLGLTIDNCKNESLNGCCLNSYVSPSPVSVSHAAPVRNAILVKVLAARWLLLKSGVFLVLCK